MADIKDLSAKLLKDSNSVVKQENKNCLENSKKRMNNICSSLSYPTKDYNPKKTLFSIKKYLDEKNKVERILYSVINNYLFSLEEEDRGVFITNIDSLLNFVLNDDLFNTESMGFTFENITDCKHIILKIYDHANLVNNQIFSSADISTKIVIPVISDMDDQLRHVNKKIEDSKTNVASIQENVEKQLKSVEKEYVAILGIFASIVFAVTGVFTFSTSVLENMQHGSMYRIIFIVLLIGVVFFNIICALFYWINKIVSHKKDVFNNLNTKLKIFSFLKNNAFVIIVNIVLLLSMIATYGCWQLGVIEQRNERFEKHNTVENYQELETSLY